MKVHADNFETCRILCKAYEEFPESVFKPSPTFIQFLLAFNVYTGFLSSDDNVLIYLQFHKQLLYMEQ